MGLVVWGALIMAALGVALQQLYRRWRQNTERERFFLGLKDVTTPAQMGTDETRRLRLLRSPWWAAWRWLPDLRRQRPR